METVSAQLPVLVVIGLAICGGCTGPGTSSLGAGTAIGLPSSATPTNADGEPWEPAALGAKIGPGALEPTSHCWKAKVRAAYGDVNEHGTLVVRVRVRIASSSGGLAAVDATQPDEDIAALNELFAPGKIQFTIVQTEVLDPDDDFYNAVHATDGALWKSFVSGVLKPLLTDSLPLVYVRTYKGVNGQQLQAYGSSAAVVLAAATLDTSYEKKHWHKTVTHEVGHFLGLFHTHSCLGPGGGDGVADTPMDPGYSAAVSSSKLQNDEGCAKVTAKPCDVDEAGAGCTALCKGLAANAAQPDPTNIMSYYPKKCLKAFSLDQLRLMRCNLRVHRPLVMLQGQAAEDGLCVDNDGDGYSPKTVGCQLLKPDGFGDWDCNDDTPTAKPGGNEVCDGFDNDCDGATDENGEQTCFDGNPCTVDACAGLFGCVADQKQCPAGQTCFDGQCKVGSACGGDKFCGENEQCCAGFGKSLCIPKTADCCWSQNIDRQYCPVGMACTVAKTCCAKGTTLCGPNAKVPRCCGSDQACTVESNVATCVPLQYDYCGLKSGYGATCQVGYNCCGKGDGYVGCCPDGTTCHLNTKAGKGTCTKATSDYCGIKDGAFKTCGADYTCCGTGADYKGCCKAGTACKIEAGVGTCVSPTSTYCGVKDGDGKTCGAGYKCCGTGSNFQRCCKAEDTCKTVDGTAVCIPPGGALCGSVDGKPKICKSGYSCCDGQCYAGVTHKCCSNHGSCGPFIDFGLCIKKSVVCKNSQNCCGAGCVEFGNTCCWNGSYCPGGTNCVKTSTTASKLMCCKKPANKECANKPGKCCD